tara:strand:+ start:326 stop:799 length:474 start_codon:yes stop_codon:yes gene_type:complete
MNKIVLAVAVLFTLFSCRNETIDEALDNGLKNYKKIRVINESLLNGYDINKLAFFKKDSTNYTFVFLLNNNTSADSVAKYSFGLVVFPEKKYQLSDKNYSIWGMQPNLVSINGYKYIIKEVDTHIKHLDSLHIFLYDRDKYRGVKSDMIRLKNIRLK